MGSDSGRMNRGGRPRSRRFRPIAADAGSLPMAMLLSLVAVSLSALLAPLVVGQIVATRTTFDRADALHAAQAGIDVMLGRIRAATDGSGNGVTADLPVAELTGHVEADGTARYRVSVTYHAADGSVVDVAGTADPPQPRKAVLEATGVESASVDPRPGARGSRTLQATYRFRTTNENIPGGMIPVNGSATSPGTLCIAAPSRTPAVGSKATVQLCAQGDPNARRFAYTKELTLQLFGSETATSAGLCLQGDGDPASPTYAHASGQQIVFATCAAVTNPHSRTLIAQQWSLRSYGTFYGTTDGTTVDNFCLNVKNPGVVGSDVVLGARSPNKHCEDGTYDKRYTFLPEPDVGAGYSGASQNWIGNGDATAARQLVSVGHQQFGRCLDIAGAYNPATYRYMIAWPCKQSPDPSKTAWNQMWVLPQVDPASKTGTGVIRAYVSDPAKTADYGKHLCLKSSGSTGIDPFVEECPTGLPAADLLWTLTADTGTYADSYVIKDNAAPGGAHLCLTPVGPNPSPSQLYQAAGYAGPPISKVVLRTCDGSQWQKWNAPPDLNQPPPITDFVED